jgi:hypothetical protein
MQIINKNFNDFKTAYINNKPTGGITKLYLNRGGDNIALFGACVMMDGSLSVINNIGEYIQLIESDSLFINNI